MRPDYVPTTEPEFERWARAFLDRVGQNREALSVDAEALDEAKRVFAEWADCRLEAKRLRVEASVAVVRKSTLRNTLETGLRQLAQQVKFSDIDDALRIQLGVSPVDRRV